MAQRRTILVVGDSFCDVNAGPLTSLPQWGINTVSPAPILAQPGGAALNVASWLQRLRGDACLFSGIGSDQFGDMLRRHLEKIGVRLLEAKSADAALPTGVCMVLSGPEDRAFCSHFGVSDSFDAAELLDGKVLRQLQPPLAHVHCAGFFSCGALRKTLPALLRAARAQGASTSLDTNNDASGQWGTVDGLWTEILPLVDLVMPNELEACAIAGVAPGDIEGAAARLVRQVAAGGHAVITRGADGALVAGPNGSLARVRAPTVAATDPVGAGDAFKAGLLACYLAGTDLADAAQYGCLTGALCVTQRGACADPPMPAAVAAFASAHGFDTAAAAFKPPATIVVAAAEDKSTWLLSGEAVGHDFEGGEARRLWWAFLLLWLGGTWAYQATLQAQAYYAHELPELSFVLLIMFTWPLLGCHVMQVVSGAAKAAGFSRRIYAAFGINALVGVAFLLQDALSLTLGTRRTVMMLLAALVAAAQVLLEPALFGLASIVAGGGATQAMMVGNASAGVVVVLASVLTRLAAGGSAPTPAQLGTSARVFFGLQVAYSCASVGLYMLLLRCTPRLAAAANGAPLHDCAPLASDAALPPASSTTTIDGMCIGDGSHAGGDACVGPTASQAGSREALMLRWRALCAAARTCWLPAACQAICFSCTLAAWPSVPGAACVAGGWMPQSWWFTLVVAVYNALDFLSRLHLKRLQRLARRMSPRLCLQLCLVRTLLVPLVYACVSPDLLAGVGGNVTIILATSVLAVSNGLLATASMMQVAKLSPPGLQEEGVYVAVAGTYLGLASGATFSWLMAGGVLNVAALDCGVNRTSS